MISGEPKLYSLYADGILLEAGHFLLRRRYLQRNFGSRIVTMDPRTPVFQFLSDALINHKTKKVRSSYLKLARKHGGPVWDRTSHLKPVKPSDLSLAECKDLCYGLNDLYQEAECSIVLPPYFVFQSLEDKWFRINISLFQSMRELSKDPVFMVLAFDYRLLENTDDLIRLRDILVSYSPDGYAIWPISLDETSAAPEFLYGLALLLEGLKAPALMLYGGFFTMLLSAITRASFSNGPCFYEKRDAQVAPALNFRLKCGYYLPQIYRRVDPVAAVVFYRLLREMGMESSLCRVCQQNTQKIGLDGLASMPELDVFEHNLLVKRGEMEYLDGLSNILLGIESDFSEALANRDEFSRFRPLNHIENWLSAVREMISNPPRNRY